MTLYDLMMKRRSVRIFKDQEISESIIAQLVDVANQAPTGGNIQLSHQSDGPDESTFETIV